MCCEFSRILDLFSLFYSFFIFFTIDRGLCTFSSFEIPVFLFREELFENPDSGASQDAMKVLLLITDGDPSDRDTRGTIEKYELRRITRFVIAVSCLLCLIYIYHLSPTIVLHFNVTTCLLLTKSEITIKKKTKKTPQIFIK